MTRGTILKAEKGEKYQTSINGRIDRE